MIQLISFCLLNQFVLARPRYVEYGLAQVYVAIVCHYHRRKIVLISDKSNTILLKLDLVLSR